MTPAQLTILTRGERAVNSDGDQPTQAQAALADADELEAFARATAARR